MYFTCCKLNVAARNLIEAAENAPDQASSGGRTSQVEPKRHTMHFVGQRSEEGQSVGVQRHSLDISSAERLTEGLNSSSSTGSISSPNRQVMWALLIVLFPPCLQPLPHPLVLNFPIPPLKSFPHPPAYKHPFTLLLKFLIPPAYKLPTFPASKLLLSPPWFKVSLFPLL